MFGREARELGFRCRSPGDDGSALELGLRVRGRVAARPYRDSRAPVGSGRLEGGASVYERVEKPAIVADEDADAVELPEQAFELAPRRCV